MRYESFITLISRFEEINTEPQIQHTLVMFLRWWVGENNMDVEEFSDPIKRALDQQFRLGWNQH
jgi:hypothetical protein